MIFIEGESFRTNVLYVAENDGRYLLKLTNTIVKMQYFYLGCCEMPKSKAVFDWGKSSGNASNELPRGRDSLAERDAFVSRSFLYTKKIVKNTIRVVIVVAFCDGRRTGNDYPVATGLIRAISAACPMATVTARCCC